MLNISIFNQSFYLEELLSPLITPFILLYALRPKSLTIIDFLRQFTIEVEGIINHYNFDIIKVVDKFTNSTSLGVGDVCSFAEMDIKRHGDPKV